MPNGADEADHPTQVRHGAGSVPGGPGRGRRHGVGQERHRRVRALMSGRGGAQISVAYRQPTIDALYGDRPSAGSGTPSADMSGGCVPGESSVALTEIAKSAQLQAVRETLVLICM